MPTLRSLKSKHGKEIVGDRFVVCNGLTADFQVDDPACDRSCHFTIDRLPAGYTLMSHGVVFVNGQRVDQQVRINAGDRICIGNTLLVFEEVASHDDPTRLAVATETDNLKLDTEIEVLADLPITIGREASRLVKRLDHPSVSRRHAEVIGHENRVTIRDLGSSNGTYVNGVRIHRRADIKKGDRVGLGPYHFVLRDNRLCPIESGNRFTRLSGAPNADLSCCGLTRTVSSNGLDLLSNVSVRLATGQFTAIIGPSGAGKSTLLKAMGNRETDRHQILRHGDIHFAGVNLVNNFDQLKHQIAFVPQHEILFDDLTLEESLLYTAALRLPDDATSDELKLSVRKAIETVSLSDIASTQVGRLSGGQRKRAALASELIADPGLLLLDEVTSGLDELTDCEMMALFARVAAEKKTVACVTHSVSSVAETCDQVIALSRFGRLAFAGKPSDALRYFGVSHLRDVYSHLLAESPEQADTIAKRFAESEFCSALPLESDSGLRIQLSESTQASTMARALSGLTDMDVSFSPRQFGIITRRYLRRIVGDHRGNAMRALQMVIVAFLLALVFGSLADPAAQINCAFILCLSSYWFGCNNAAKEIVSERRIFEQERNVVLKIHSYAWSKFSVLSAVAALQAIGLTLFVQWWCGLVGPEIAWCLLTSAIAVAGTATGLAISAGSRNEQIAVAAVPIALIPQIILAGAVADLSGAGLWIAKIAVTSYWGFRSATEIVDSPGSIPKFLWTTLIIVALQALIAFYLTMQGLRQKH